MRLNGILCQWISEIDARIGSELVQLINATVADGGTLGYERPMTPDQEGRFVADLRDDLAGGRCHLLLGRAGPQPAFMVLLHLNPMGTCRHRAELAKGVVHPAYRGMHLVQMAFEEIARQAEALGVEQLVLDVREGSRAHRLWQRYGFQTYGVLEDYARVQGIAHRGHFMVQAVAALRQRLAAASADDSQGVDHHVASPA